MNLAISNRALFRAVSFAIFLAGAVPNPLYGQARRPLEPATVPAGEAEASIDPAEILRQLRERDPQGALDTLGMLVDQPLSIRDLVYSGLPAAAAGLNRSLAQMSADERYELLYQWSLPEGDGSARTRVRLLAAAVPTDAPPKVFARSIGERPRDSTFAVAAIGPVRGFFCSGWMLAQAADELGRLARLRSTLEKLTESNVDGASELLMLAYLAGRRGELERVQTFLQESVSDQGGEAPQGLQPQDMTDAAIASAALLHEKLQPLGESLLKKLVYQGGVGDSIALRPFLRIAHATAAQVHRGKSPPEVLFRNQLKHWVPATVRSASDIDRGRPSAVWLTHERHVLHLAGGTADVLFCRFPIVGEFDFVCETQEGGAIGTDGGLVYGGLQFQALGRKDTLTVWDADVNQMVTKPSPFARHDTAPVFNRVSIRSAKDGPNFESNFHPVWFDGPVTQSSPWIGLRSSGTKRPVFRNIRLSGNPLVPREVQLTTDSDQLRGWQAGFFGETLPNFHSRVDTIETSSETADWRIESSELVSSRQTDARSSEKPGWLRYQRPLLGGDSIRYEFLHRGDDAIVHPTIGRLAFLLEPTGVRVRWITTGDLEWSGLESDNAALEPLNRRGPRPLPLREDDWNSLRVELSDNKVLITLNDELVYQRPVDPNSETQFGLYRPTRNAEARVRKVLMTGDWPETVPEDFMADPVALAAATGPPQDRDVRGPLLGGDVVADNVLAIRRLTAELPADQRFEFLARWVVPSETHSDFRVAGRYLPTNLPPPVKNDAGLYQRRELSTEDQESRLVSPVFDLLDIAKRERKLPDLRRRIGACSTRDPPGQQAKAALLAMVDLELGNTASAAKSITLLHDAMQETPPADARHHHWPAMMVAHHSLERTPVMAPVGDLISHLVASMVVPNDSTIPTAWQSNIQSLGAKLWRQEWGSSAAGINQASELDQWIPISPTTSSKHGTGHAGPQWNCDEQGTVTHASGFHIDYLTFASPLRGDYCVEAELSSDQLGQILNAGHFVGADYQRGRFHAGELGIPSNPVPLTEPLGKFDRWIHYRATVTSGIEQVFLNGRRVQHRKLPSHADPWLALRSWYKSGARFREVRIGGGPIIPDQVSLSQSPDLAGWTAYFGNPIRSEGTHWRTTADGDDGVEILGSHWHGLNGSSCERLLRYFRPLDRTSTVEFEFFYEPESATTSPALDRLVFMLTPQGVAEHWITDGQYDQTLLRPDNLHHVASNQRHDGEMPLQVNDWNHVRIEVAGADVRLLLNSKLIYERELEPDNGRTFGLFHFAGQGTARVRRVTMHGSWPTELGDPQQLADPLPDQLDKRLPALAFSFTDDFRPPTETNQLFDLKGARSNGNVTETVEGRQLEVTSSGVWQQLGLSPRFSMHGDFDVTAGFSGIRLPTSAEMARVAIMISLDDVYQRRLIAAMASSPSQGLHVMGSVNLFYADGTTRYLSGRRADESTSGRLRIARRGDRVYFMSAQGDSGHWRMIHQETASTADVDTGGVQLLTIAKGAGTTTVVWKDVTLRAEKLMTVPTTQPRPTLSVFRSDESEIHDLTQPTGTALTLGSPAWSPDGKRIAYDQSASGTRDSRLMIINKFEHQPTDIGYGSMPTFSPDGRQIAFSAAGEGVGIMNADGTGRRILDPRGWGIQWSSDPNRLAYSIGGNLYLWDVKKASSTPLLRGTAASRYSYLYWNFGWSPDGRHIAFKGRRRDNGRDEISVATLSNPSRVRVLVPEFKGGNCDLFWSTDSRNVLLPIRGVAPDESQLFAIDRINGGPPQLVTGQPADRRISGADLSPDGQWFAVSATANPVPVPWSGQAVNP